jgi:hypothetical protein
MKNIIQLVVIIIAIVALITIIGFVIGTITHNMKIENEQEVTTQHAPVIEEKITEPLLPEFEELFSLQIMASSNNKKIKLLQDKLKPENYETKISKLKRDGLIIYRLRLTGLYNEKDAKELGEELKEKFASIEGYWLEEQETRTKIIKTKQEVTKPVEASQKELIKPEYEKEIKITKKKINFGKKCEVQLLVSGDYEIQILANSKRSFVEERKIILEKAGYRAKIVTTTNNGKTFYRLRLANSYSQSKAKQVGDKLKKDVRFVSDCWIVPKSGVSAVAPQKAKEKEKIQDESLYESTRTSLNPKYQPKYKKQQNTMTCVANDINIRIGPGTYYAIDPIGKLMKGVTVFVVDEKNDWIKFTITADDESWAGWVNKKYLR